MFEWKIEIPDICGEGENRILIKSLMELAVLLESHRNAGFIAQEPQRVSRKLILVPSNCEEALLECVLYSAYGSYEHIDDRYVFIDTGIRPDYFDSMAEIFASLKLGVTTPVHRMASTIMSILDESDGIVSSNALRREIEISCFPSGAEEIQELLYRNSSQLHDVFNILESTNKDYEKRFPAIRLLFGAFAAGDITKETVYSVLIGLKKDGSVWEPTKRWLNEVEEKRKLLNLRSECVCPLSEYLAGRNILLIEDELRLQYWDVILPRIFGSASKLRFEDVTDLMQGLHVTHVKNIRDANNNFGTKLSEFDIVLLDLFSSASKLAEGDRHGASLLVVSEPLKRFMALAGFSYEDQREFEQEDVVPTSLPQVVIFSGHSSGITCRTMLKDIGATDYFFKEAYSEPHKGAYYATFRNALITGLKENVANVLSLPRSGRHSNLDRWLSQFLPRDRSMVVRIMKHFRYYPAMSIVETFNLWLERNIQVVRDDKVQMSLCDNKLFSPDCLWFSYIGRPNKSGPSALALLGKTIWVEKINKRIRDTYKDHSPKKSGTAKEEWPFPEFKTYSDLQKDLIHEIVGPSERRGKNHLCIVLVDDVIGSGGQLESYLWKFLQNIIQKLKKEIGIRNCQIGGFEVNKNLGISTKGKQEGIWIEIHVLFAVGIEIAEREVREYRVKKTYNPGQCEVTVCIEPKSKHDKVQDCTCGGKLQFYLHIAEHTDDIFRVLHDERIDPAAALEMFMRYTLITRPRRKEHPCDFEPLGWKHCGGLVATYANAPSNTLPIIWGHGGDVDWYPLFNRFFNPWDEGILRNLPCSKDPAKCVLSPGKGCNKLLVEKNS